MRKRDKDIFTKGVNGCKHLGPRVAVVRGSDRKTITRKAVELLGGMDKFISKGDKVLIKPNMFTNTKEDIGFSTRPQVVEALVEMALEAGASKVYVGERGAMQRDIFEGTKVLEMAEMIRFDDADFDIVRIPGAKALKFGFRIPKILRECKVINVPVAKVHALTQVTLSLKNLMGYICACDTGYVHLSGLLNSIIDLSILKKPVLNVIDMTTGCEGNVPAFPTSPVKMNTVIASTDMVAVDAVAAYIMGFDPQEIRLIVLAHKRGLGEMDLKKIEIIGENPDALRRRFNTLWAESDWIDEYFEFIRDTACDACENAVRCGLTAIKALEGVDFIKEVVDRYGKPVIVIGPREKPIEGRKIVFYLGNCTARWMDEGFYHPGCPPLANQIRVFVSEVLKGILRGECI